MVSSATFSARAFGIAAKPRRHPVMANDLENPSTRIVRVPCRLDRVEARSRLIVVDEIRVDLVGHDPDVALDGEPGDRLQILSRDGPAGGIRGRVDDQQLGLVAHPIGQKIEIERKAACLEQRRGDRVCRRPARCRRGSSEIRGPDTAPRRPDSPAPGSGTGSPASLRGRPPPRPPSRGPWSPTPAARWPPATLASRPRACSACAPRRWPACHSRRSASKVWKSGCPISR